MLEHSTITNSQQSRAVYDTLQSSGWLQDRSSIMRRVLHILAVQPERRMLDVACGNGQLGQMVEKLGVQYYGVDFLRTQIYHPHIFVSDGIMLPFPVAVFDYVVNIGSLEHFLDMEQGVREMARVLKPDGLACVLLPNLFGLTWSVLRGWRTGDIDIEDRQPVQRFGTRKAWQRLLDTNGLKVQRVIGYERVLPASLTEWRLYLELPGEILLALLAPILPTNLQRCFIFLCRRS